ncbi:MAG: hypothetical protein ABL916_16160 [Burkholderiaceae bacterium]
MGFELNWEPRGVYRAFRGHVTVQDRRQSLEAICADRRFDDLLYTITDYLGIDSFDYSQEANSELAALHIGPVWTNPRILIATVAVDAALVASVSEFIALGFVKSPQRIFDSVATARAWIERSHPSLR